MQARTLTSESPSSDKRCSLQRSNAWCEMPQSSFIRVLVVDDSAVVQHLLRTVIDAEPDMVVVGTAQSGKNVLELVDKLRPDLITMDVIMPGENGISIAQRVMAARPTPIAVVTAAPVGPDSDILFEALSAGAVDVIAKP